MRSKNTALTSKVTFRKYLMAESVALKEARWACSNLSSKDLEILLTDITHSNRKLALKAWNGNDATVPCGNARPFERPSLPVSIATSSSCSVTDDMVTGCPWCRRPVTIVTEDKKIIKCTSTSTSSMQHAYVSLLYGPKCHNYFFGALVLGWGLARYGGADIARILMHTSDVPAAYIHVLNAAGWNCHQVQYLNNVAHALFHNPWTSRFIDVFTKLRMLELDNFDKVLFLDLDMLVRPPKQKLQ